MYKTCAEAFVRKMFEARYGELADISEPVP